MSHDPFTDQAQHEAQQRQLAIQHEQARRRLWTSVAAATAAASNSTDASVPINWADHALKAFDQRFPAPPQG